jgi:serine protease Do
MKHQYLAAGLAIMALNLTSSAEPLGYGSNESFLADMKLQMGHSARDGHKTLDDIVLDHISDNLQATVMILVENVKADPKTEKEVISQEGNGSGAIITTDGLVVTNAHVVKEGNKYTAVLNDKRQLPAFLVGLDIETDLAVLKIDGYRFPTIRWGDKRKLREGEKVVAIGAPKGLHQSVTRGSISHLHRSMGYSNYEDSIQTDAAVNGGSSGGPLFHAASGELIGLNSAILTKKEGFQGIAFAIPAHMVRAIAARLIKDGEMVRDGSLGLMVVDLTPDVRMETSAPRGVHGAAVTSVEGHNHASGLEVGDVIVEMDGTPLTNMFDLRWKASLMAVGSTTSVKVWRRGQMLNFTITVGPRPPEPKSKDKTEPKADQAE